MDGKLMLVSNVQDMKSVDVVRRYKSLADIERGFRVLKSDIEIAPVASSGIPCVLTMAPPSSPARPMSWRRSTSGVPRTKRK
jgi:hypothetical protein